MDFEPLAPPAGHDASLDHQGVSAGPQASPSGTERELDATLRLLKGCVEALGLLQGKVEDLDARWGLMAAAQPISLADVQAGLSPVKDALAGTGVHVATMDARLTQLESSVADYAKRHADDISAARFEAANWRMRVETDGMAFDQLSARLAALEQGLSGRLGETQQALAERESENEHLRAETRVVESVSDSLRARLATMDATNADQRARIGCLQNKLATATYAIRFEHLSRAMDGSLPSGEILDLTSTLTTSLVSAA